MDNLKWYYGRDLRNLTDEEIENAFSKFITHPKKSLTSKYAWQNILSEKRWRDEKLHPREWRA